jgi:lipopolysaccharide transport system permease protein
MLQAVFYLSPIVYPMTQVSARHQWLLALNPMTGMVEGYRSAILGKPWNFTALAISSVCAGAWFVFGLFFFRRTERNFADIA